MKSITYFYLKGCPHCKKADAILKELMEENPQYNQLKIHYIEETENMEYCDMMAYYYVTLPSWRFTPSTKKQGT